MVAQPIDQRRCGEQGVGESQATPLQARADEPQPTVGGSSAKDTAETTMDERVEELLSSEGEAGAHQKPASTEEMDASLDDLLEGFTDETMPENDLAAAEAFDPNTPSSPGRWNAPEMTQATDKFADEAEPTKAAEAHHRPEEHSVAPATAPKARRERGALRGVALVLLGGILGAALTLLGLLLTSGTLDYASRGHLEALSRNMGTMQANQEVIWQRLDGIDPLVVEQQERIEALGAALQQAEDELGVIEQRAAAAEEQVAVLSQEVALLQQTLASSLDQSDQRMGVLEGQAAELGRGLQDVETTLSPLKSAVVRYNGFFGALRDLLVEMDVEE